MSSPGLRSRQLQRLNVTRAAPRKAFVQLLVAGTESAVPGLSPEGLRWPSPGRLLSEESHTPDVPILELARDVRFSPSRASMCSEGWDGHGEARLPAALTENRALRDAHPRFLDQKRVAGSCEAIWLAPSLLVPCVLAEEYIQMMEGNPLE